MKTREEERAGLLLLVFDWKTSETQERIWNSWPMCTVLSAKIISDRNLNSRTASSLLSLSIPTSEAPIHLLYLLYI